MRNGKLNYNEIVFTDFQLNDIKNSYLSGESSVKIGKRYGCNHHKILSVLHGMNVGVDRTKSIRKYHVDETYFDKIDTQNKAYILGFLFADGHNAMSKSTLTMSLQEEDFDILEKIRIELSSDKPLEFLDYSNKHDFGYHYKNQYRMNVFSKHICDSLNNIGMTTNKSLTLRFPTIDPILYSHFIRGYFDGDGTIKKKTGSFGITSTFEFVNNVKSILDDSLGLKYGILTESSCKNGITYDLNYHRKSETSKIFEWMYSDAELYMKRKYNFYKEYFKDYINNSLVA